MRQLSLSLSFSVSLCLSLSLSLSLSNPLLLSYERETGRSLYACVQRRRLYVTETQSIYHLQPTGHVIHHQFNIQQLYALPTLYLCVLYLYENKQRLVRLTA